MSQSVGNAARFATLGVRFSETLTAGGAPGGQIRFDIQFVRLRQLSGNLRDGGTIPSADI